MTDQDHRHVPRGDRPDDQVQVGAEAFDAGRARRGAPGTAVVPLVPEHQPVLAQRGALEVPAVLVQRVAVGEDVVSGAPRARPVRARGRLIDLDVQRDPVIGQHGERLPAQLAQPRRGRGGAPHLDPAYRDPFGRYHGAGARRQAPAASPATPVIRRQVAIAPPCRASWSGRPAVQRQVRLAAP